MQSFSELLRMYMARTGVSDAELARAVGVRRQTIFRWKEGLVARPRHREDVLALARKLRLSPEELDALLLAAGFPPEQAAAAPDVQPAVEPDWVDDHPLLRGGPTLPAPGPALPEPRPAPRVPPFLRVNKWTISLAALLLLGLILVNVLAGRRVSYPLAAPGETLVVVAQFANFTGGAVGFNVAGRLAEPLAEELAAAALVNARVAVWPDVVRNGVEAESVLQRSQARMVIWGEYDSGRVVARFTQAEATAAPSVLESLVASPTDLTTAINSELPEEVRYLALFTLGQLYARSEAYPQARAILRRAQQDPPADEAAQVSLFFYLGVVHQLGDPPAAEDAVAYYDAALALRPDHMLARYNRALALLDRGWAGDVARALTDFSRVIDRHPSYLPAYIGRGVAYFYRGAPGDEEAAVRDFSHVIQVDPSRALAFYNRGLIEIRRDERAGWEEDLTRTIDLAPTFPGGYSALCWGYVLENEPARAMPLCDQAIALGAAEALHSRGIAWALQGETDAALQDFRAFLRWLAAGSRSAAPYQYLAPEVEGWVEALEAGRLPLRPEELERLRGE